jgi:hypothetical protein
MNGNYFRIHKYIKNIILKEVPLKRRILFKMLDVGDLENPNQSTFLHSVLLIKIHI